MKFDKLVEQILNEPIAGVPSEKDFNQEWASYVADMLPGFELDPQWDLTKFDKAQHIFDLEHSKSVLFNIENTEALKAIATGDYSYSLKPRDLNKDFLDNSPWF